MKYPDTTQEQRKSITPYLLRILKSQNFFRKMLRNKLRGDNTWETPIYEIRRILRNHDWQIKAFQQAQKEEIKSLEIQYIVIDNKKIMIETHWPIQERIKQLKFESELE